MMENTSKNKFLLIKLGGSLIAPKGTSKFRNVRLKKTSTLIDSFTHKQKIIINGTGHFGHDAVNAYGVNESSYMKIHTTLHKYFSMVDEYFPLYTRISGEGIYEDNYDKTIFDQFDKLIIGGSVTHSKTVSSEKIYKKIQQKLTPPITYMLTDVDGVFDKDGNVIPIINNDNIGSLHFYKKEGDASGGMKEKIEQLQEVGNTYHGKTRIINGNDIDNVKNVILNDTGIGTQVYF